MKRLFLLLLIPLFIHSEDALRLIGDCEPMLTVGNCVNAASGNFFYSRDDIVVDGPEKLVFSRNFDSNAADSGQLGRGMFFGFPTAMIQTSMGEFNLLFEEQGGMYLPYKENKKSGQSFGAFNIQSLLKSGATNLGHLNAHGRVQDRVLIKGEKEWKATLSDGTERTFRYYGNIGQRHQYCLKEERLPSGLVKVYDYQQAPSYESSTLFFPQRIRVQNPSKTRTYSTLKFQKEPKGLSVSASNGQTFSIKLENAALGRHEIGIVPRSTSSNWLGNEIYEQKINTKKCKDFKIRNMHFGNDFKVKVDYNKQGKAGKIYYPLKKRGTYAPAYTLFYEKGYTDVIDYDKTHTRYEFTAEKRLTARHSYLDKKIYSTNAFFWYPSDERDRLLGTALLDASGKALFFKKLSYKRKGNLSEERIYGNLTGTKPSRFTLNKDHAPQEAVDAFIIQKNYTDNCFNNLESEIFSSGLKKEWQYLPLTNLPTAEYISWNGKIEERTFYCYDEDHLLIAIIQDDGLDKREINFEGVSYRIIERFTHCLNEGPACGLPSSRTRVYIDFSTGEEKLLSRSEYFYNRQGLKTEEKLYDCQGSYYGSNKWFYNEKRECTGEEDPLGRRVVYEYDAFSKKISETREGLTKHFFYNAMGRVIQEKITTVSGEDYSAFFEYDFKGNITSQTDPYGNVTTFTYDALGRKTSETNPEGQTKLFTYDEAGNLTTEVSEDGGVIQKEYTAYGKPFKIVYPDGASEKISYFTNGEVASACSRDGTITKYTRDYRGREIREETYAPTGELLYAVEKEYKGELLLFETDRMGRRKIFEYDGACRKIAEAIEEQRTEFSYDVYGNLSETRYFDKGVFQFAEVKVFDSCHRLIEEFYRDQDGSIKERVEYAYDGSDRKIAIKKEDSQVYYSYDSMGRLLTETDSSGNVTTYAYPDLQTIIMTFPTGKFIKKELNWRGEVMVSTTYDPFGNAIALSKTAYDCAGREAEVSHAVIYKNENLGNSITAYQYDLEGRLVFTCEQAHASRSRSHYMEYDASGRLIKKIKPDGIELENAYDMYGFLKEVVSSDGTVHFRYEYDCEGNPLRVENLVTGKETLRSYDFWGRLVEETQETGLSLGYAHDDLSRPTTLTLPDGSKIAYGYKGRFLNTVERKGGIFTYDRDSQGRPVKIANPAFLSTFSWNHEGRLVDLATPKYSQKLTSFDTERNLLSQVVQEKEEAFTYDHLSHLTSENGQTFTWDSVENRRSKNGEEIAVNEMNQITAFTYDANGNRLSDDRAEYVYNALDQLTKVIFPDKTVEFFYDFEGRRLFETQGEESYHYFYAGDTELGRVYCQKIDQLRILGNGLNSSHGAALAFELDSKTYYPIYNARGDIVQLLDEHQNIAEEIIYNAFGEEAQKTNLSPWRFSGSRTLEHLNLFLYRAYDPASATWLTPDPIGTADGPNLYAYVRGNPILYIDPLGLYGEIIEDKNYERRANTYWEWRFRRAGDTWTPIHSKTYYQPGIRFVEFVRSHTNGVQVNKNEFLESLKYLSELSEGAEIYGTHNASFGPDFDIGESKNNIFNNVATTPVWKLVKSFRQQLSNYRFILHSCHSQGTAITKLALMLLEPEERERIHVLAIAPSSYIDDNLCGSVQHFVADRDWIPSIDRAGKKRNEHTIKYVGKSVDGWFDHSLRSSVYKQHIQDWFDKKVEDLRLWGN